ncbi:hypothetical protein [Mesorhizobium carmichaelinearum]|nr:hypothetical protein [Mesorhizobium carmichaelinearum]
MDFAGDKVGDIVGVMEDADPWRRLRRLAAASVTISPGHVF